MRAPGLSVAQKCGSQEENRRARRRERCSTAGYHKLQNVDADAKQPTATSGAISKPSDYYKKSTS